MPEVKITGNAQGVKTAAKEAENAVRQLADTAARDAEKASEKAQQKAKKSAEAVSKAGSAVSAVGSEIGGVFSKAGQVIAAVVSGPLGATLAALGAIVAGAKELYNSLTVSSEEAAKIAQFSADALAGDIGRQQKQTGIDSGYMQRLSELSQQESLSNQQKKEAADLIQMLSGRYGDLGISIDSVTGKISGMDAAQRNFNEKTLRELQSKRKEMIKELMNVVAGQSTEAMNESDGRNSLNPFTRWGYLLRGGEAEGYQKRFMKADLDSQIRFASKMVKDASTEDQIEKWTRVYQTLIKVRDIRDEMRTAEEKYNTQQGKKGATGPDTYASTVEGLRKELELREAVAKGTEKQYRELELLHKLEAEKGDRSLRQVMDEVAALSKKREEIEKLEKAQARDKAFTDAMQRQTDIRKGMDPAATYDEQKKRYINDKIIEFEKQNGSLTAAQRQKMADSLGDTFDKKETMDYQKRLSLFEDSLKIRKLELQGLHEEAELQRKINQERQRKGRDLTSDELDLLELQNRTEFALADAEKRAERERERAGRIDPAKQFNSDRLIQMGERVNAISGINYPAKTYTSVDHIEKTVDKVLSEIAAKKGSVFP